LVPAPAFPDAERLLAPARVALPGQAAPRGDRFGQDAATREIAAHQPPRRRQGRDDAVDGGQRVRRQRDVALAGDHARIDGLRMADDDHGHRRISSGAWTPIHATAAASVVTSTITLTAPRASPVVPPRRWRR